MTAKLFSGLARKIDGILTSKLFFSAIIYSYTQSWLHNKNRFLAAVPGFGLLFGLCVTIVFLLLATVAGFADAFIERMEGISKKIPEKKIKVEFVLRPKHYAIMASFIVIVFWAL
ncbi:MAG: hypothetical protein NUV67_04345 [archaeon]|nr:hypothetical protein [archaeon]